MYKLRQLTHKISQQESHGTARFVVHRTCAKYRDIEVYRVCRFIDVILESYSTPVKKSTSKGKIHCHLGKKIDIS